MFEDCIHLNFSFYICLMHTYFLEQCFCHDVIKDTKNKCISEGLMYVAAWYLRTHGRKFTKFRE